MQHLLAGMFRIRARKQRNIFAGKVQANRPAVVPHRVRLRSRAALALALALALPTTVPERQAIITTAFVVVAFSILVQGLTMPWLIKRLNLGREAETEPVAAPAAAD